MAAKLTRMFRKERRPLPDSQQKTLTDLVSRTATGDRHAFDALYDTTSARLNALCLSILRDRRMAEEALEQVYVQIWKDSPRHAESGLTAMAWLATLARGIAISHRAADPDRPDPAGIPDRSDTAPDPAAVLRAAWLEGLGYSHLAARTGLSEAEARHLLHEGLERLSGHAADDGDSFAAAEQALGLRSGTATLHPDVVPWQERLARFADDLIPVMAPARARQRIREALGHGRAPLSVDPTEQRPWWRGPVGIALAIIAVAAGWYLATR